MPITSIRLYPETIQKINWIKEWLKDLPFTDVKEPSTSEVIRIAIEYYYNDTIKDDKI